MGQVPSIHNRKYGGMKKKLLLIAYRAWGDWLYTVPVLPYLFNTYDVYLETNWKIFQLVYNDPRFKHISYFIYEQYPQEQWSSLFPKRWNAVIQKLKPDKVINLNGSLEVECIGENFQKEFYLPMDQRRNYFGHKAFYDAIFERCQITPPIAPKLDELYYSPKEIEIVENWRQKEKDKFITIIPLAGSTSQKVLHNFVSITQHFLTKYEHSVVYLAGDEKCQQLIPKGYSRIKNMCNTPIKQSFLMAKYANYVVGPETGLVVAAGMWGTPKTMFCTTSSVYQCTKYQKNDFSIQAPIYCSPCHRAIYSDTDCHEMYGNLVTKTLYPACSKLFTVQSVVSHIDAIYNKYLERGNFVPPPYKAVPSPFKKVDYDIY